MYTSLHYTDVYTPKTYPHLNLSSVYNFPCFAMVQNAHVFAGLQSRRVGIQHEQLHHHPAFRVARQEVFHQLMKHGSGTGQNSSHLAL